MGEQTVRLLRSDKNFLSGMRKVERKLNEEAKELNWLDKNIEYIRDGKLRALKYLQEREM